MFPCARETSAEIVTRLVKGIDIATYHFDDLFVYLKLENFAIVSVSIPKKFLNIKVVTICMYGSPCPSSTSNATLMLMMASTKANGTSSRQQ